MARARFIEDLVEEQAGRGVRQYVIPGRGPRHICPAPAGDRLPPAGLRGRPAGSSGVEAAAPDRTRLRHPGVVAVRAGRFRGGWLLVGASGDRRVRRRPASRSWLHRRHRVPHPGRDRCHAPPDRGARPGSTLATTFMLPLRLLEPEERPLRQATERFARAAGTPFITSSPRRRSWPWPATPGSETRGTCRPPV